MAGTTRLERASHVVPGDRSELRLEDGHITLTKEAGTQARPTSVTVPVDQVRSVTLHRPSRGQPGWLHLAVVNGSPTPPSELAASGDPYTLPLTTRHLHAARRLERMIVDHVHRRGLPHVESGTAAGTGSGVILNPDLNPDPPAPSASTPRSVDPDPSRFAPAEPGGAADPPPPPPPPPTDSSSEDLEEEPGEEIPRSELAGHLREIAELHEAGAPTDSSSEDLEEEPGEEIPRSELAGHLREIAELHEAGALSDTEFEQAKRRVLGD